MAVGPLLSKKDEGLLKSWERHLKAENKAERTIDHYLGTARLFGEFCIQNNYPSLYSAKRDAVEEWLGAMRGNRSPNTVNSYFRALRVYYNWLVDEEEIPRSPMAKIKEPAKEDVAKDIVSLTDLDKVLVHLEKKKEWRDAALIAVLFDTGLRASEVADMLTEDVNLDAGIALVRHTKAKRFRTVHLHPRTIRYLDRYHRQTRPAPEYLITGKREKLTRSGVSRAVKKVFAELQVKGVIGAHDLRHTSATHAVTEMTESQMMALYGWSSPTMVRHYAHQALADAAIKAHKRSSPMGKLKKE